MLTRAALKRGAAIATSAGGVVNGEVVRGAWDQLPHNIGNLRGEQMENAAAVARRKDEVANQEVCIKNEGVDIEARVSGEQTSKAESVRRRVSKDSIKLEQEVKSSNKRSRQRREDEKPSKRRAPNDEKGGVSKDIQSQTAKLIDTAEIPVKKSKRSAYGITPGVSPYPDFPMPTPEACYEVHRLLSEAHGVVEQPKTIPPPSLEVTGCGEVPSVLDALIRTRLSAATTNTNSAYAFAGLVGKFGTLEDGIGKGSVDWNRVREADVKVIEQSIKRGGLAATKSKSIKEILNMVYGQNKVRREAFIREKATGQKADVAGAENLEQGQKDLEIAAAEQDILSLQFMHGLTPDEALAELTNYPGIGLKTASCVILFCLRRPSFAVDTHVFRLCKWLGWIPESATRDKAFSHCEVRVPDELKYDLHQLLIRHGRTCGRCRAATGETSEAWRETVCPIEGLVTRTGKKKLFRPAMQLTKGGKGEEDAESGSELSELDEALFEQN